MNRFIVHGIPGSPFSRAVLATLEEKGADYRLAALAVGMVKVEPHISRHPFGRVPVLEHAAEALIEARAEPEAIARHFTAAGADDLAIEWWGKAGDEALRRSAFQEAIAHLGKAIAMVDKAEGGSPQQQTGDAALAAARSCL